MVGGGHKVPRALHRYLQLLDLAEVAFEAMRILGGNGYSKDFPIERYYRDAPLVVIGGGTNELQRLIIAKNLLKKYRDG